MQVYKSQHCCAVYCVGGLHNTGFSKTDLEDILARAKVQGGDELPLIIEFSDADEYGHGERLYKLILRSGYRCDKFKLGVNSKSGGHHVTLYHWFTEKKRKTKINKVRDYGQKTAARKSGATPRTRIAARRSVGIRRYL